MMGPGEAIAAVALAGVAIAVLITLGTGFQRWVAYKQRKVEVEAEALHARRAERSDDYTDMLEERVRVLERIATDRGQDIAHQIESLRERQVEQRSEAK
jgi:uncharacterized protein HemX